MNPLKLAPDVDPRFTSSAKPTVSTGTGASRTIGAVSSNRATHSPTGRARDAVIEREGVCRCASQK